MGLILQEMIGSQSMQQLNLQKCGLIAASAAAIARVLETNRSIKLLILAGNNLGDDGGAAIGRVLATNTVLEQIDLQKTQLGPAGGTAIAQALRVNTTLTEIYLNDNAFEEEVSASIRQICWSSRKLTLRL